ncbi:hypothetical protein [Streptomyces bohaiensis]|uniref:hypothetical protein n=1 Tax=Streptomyces bohaiensis TaxID=1431344 RepID=UPI003B782F50
MTPMTSWEPAVLERAIVHPPSGCRTCGRTERHHRGDDEAARRWHPYQAPDAAMIRHRMQERYAARQILAAARTEWRVQALNPHGWEHAGGPRPTHRAARIALRHMQDRYPGLEWRVVRLDHVTLTATA